MILELWVGSKVYDSVETFYTTPELFRTVLEQLKEDNPAIIENLDYTIYIVRKSKME